MRISEIPTGRHWTLRVRSVGFPDTNRDSALTDNQSACVPVCFADMNNLTQLVDGHFGK